MNSSSTPNSGEGFKSLITAELIPADHVRRARDKLRKLKQVVSVEKYLSDFRNIIFMRTDMNKGERLDKFIEGLKYSVKVKVLKSGCNQFEDFERLALNIDSAIWGARRTLDSFTALGSHLRAGLTPMEIGNVNGSTSSDVPSEQRKKYLMSGSCFNCHKKCCKP